MTRAGGYHGQLAKPAWDYGISRRLFGLLRVALESLAGKRYVSWSRHPVQSPIPSPIPLDMLADARRMTAERIRERRKTSHRVRHASRWARTHGIRAARKLGLPAASASVQPTGVWYDAWDRVKAVAHVPGEFDGVTVWESRPPRRERHGDACLYCRAGNCCLVDGDIPF